MFHESVPEYDVRYKYYLGDGDSASYPTVVGAKPHGPDFELDKLECSGHAQNAWGAA